MDNTADTGGGVEEICKLNKTSITMPKQQKRESVVYDWVSDLTFQMQALLMTSMRGPDQNNKHTPAKAIVRYLRGVILKPAGRMKSGSNDNDFMWQDYSLFSKYAAEFWFDHDHYPHHFIMHLVHCAQVVAYKHPTHEVRVYWRLFYSDACEQFHMREETEKQMDKRLNDFR